MSERYWITGVQLAILINSPEIKVRNELGKEIIAEQFVGIVLNEKDNKRLLAKLKKLAKVD